MGIRFLCPNGHRLNVKKEYAGKVGYCPECKARLIIPNVDEKPTNEPRDVVSNFPTDDSSSSEEKKRDVLRTKLFADVSLDDPNALWYVRSLDGRQYGPAAGSVIKNWIEERRIGPKMLVIRQGWEMWEEAEKVFPEIRAVFEAETNAEKEQTESEAEDVLCESVARLVDSSVARRADLTFRKRKAANSYRLILALIGLIVVLLGALIAILLTQ